MHDASTFYLLSRRIEGAQELSRSFNPHKVSLPNNLSCDLFTVIKVFLQEGDAFAIPEFHKRGYRDPDDPR